MNFPSDPDSLSDEAIASSEMKQLSPLPMEWWPESFGAARPSHDNTCYEVMLNEKAGTETWKIWKFYPPENMTSVTLLVEALKKLPPFLWNASLQEDLDTLQDFVTNRWIVLDSFSDHVARRVFLDTPEHRDIRVYYWRISKLRKNSMDQLGSAAELIDRDVPPQSITPLRLLVNELQEYDTLDFSWKVAFVKKVDSYVEQYLRDVLTLTSPIQP